MDHKDPKETKIASLQPNAQEEHRGQNICTEDPNIGNCEPNFPHMFKISKFLSLGDPKKARGWKSGLQEGMESKATYTRSSTKS